jgi:lipopolysaccharide transport system permease protein
MNASTPARSAFLPVKALPAIGQSRDLIIAFTVRELKLRYRGTLLGYAWWLARPLAMGVLLWFALGKVLRLGVPDYHLFLMAGLFPWYWFSSAVSQSADIFVGNSSLIKKAVFPRIVLPLSAVLSNTIQFVFTLPVLLAFVLVAGKRPDAVWLVGLPVLLLLQFALIMGVAALVSSLNVFFRDLAPLVDVALNMLFYASAVIYPLARVPDDVKPLLLANPMTSLMEGWRRVVLENSLPGAEIWPAVGLSVVAVFLGMGIFRSVQGHFADAL